MTQAKKSTLENYKSKIKFTTKKNLPFSQGYAINALVKNYKIPVKKWGYDGALIGLETNKQYLFWRDIGGELEFKGLLNKKVKK